MSVGEVKQTYSPEASVPSAQRVLYSVGPLGSHWARAEAERIARVTKVKIILQSVRVVRVGMNGTRQCIGVTVTTTD